MKHSLLFRRTGAVVMASAVLLTSAAVMPVVSEKVGIKAEAVYSEDHLLKAPDGYTEIRTVSDLYGIRSEPSGNFILMNDIDLSETAPNGNWDAVGNGWLPIPTFSGVLDGNGYEIKNMYIFGDTYEGGFIGENIGEIKNLHFTNVNVDIYYTGTEAVKYGTICEVLKDGGKIALCSVDGKINVSAPRATQVNVGGLAAGTAQVWKTYYFYRPVTSDSYNQADITVNASKGYVGGITGYFYSQYHISSDTYRYGLPLIENCYNNGDISSNISAGGIVGFHQGELINCINLKDGSLYGTLGSFKTDKKVSIYSHALFSEAQGYVSNNITPIVCYCYYLAGNTFGEGLKEEELTSYLKKQSKKFYGQPLRSNLIAQQGSYEGWDFETIWKMSDNGTHPVLKDNCEISAESIEIAQMPTKLNYKIGEDIEASGTITVTYSNGNTNTVNITKDMLSGYDMTQGGTQDVTVTYQGCETTYEITVSSTPVTSVSISDSEIYLATGEIYKLTATVSPDNATNKTLKWTTSDSSVATVSDGKVTAVGSGLAVITVKSNNNKSASCIVNVDWSDDDDVDPSAVSLNKTQLNLEKGKTETLTASILPKNATNTNVTWRSSNAKIATVTDGKVTGIAAGTATIFAITGNGLTASCTVTVTEPAQTTKLKNNSEISSASVTANTELTLTAKAEGGTAPYKYAYYYKKSTDSSWTKLVTENGSAYVTASTQQFKPTSAGTYNIRINVKDQGGTGTVASKEFTVTVKAAENTALTNNSTVSAASVKANTEVTLTGKATGGTSPYKYAYYYKKSTDSSWTKAYVTSSGSAYTKYDSVTFKPTTAGTYDVRINIKDEYGNGKVVSKDFKLTVTADSAALKNNSTMSVSSVTANTTVTLNGKAEGGTSPYKYAYYYKKSTDSSWTKAYVTSSGSVYTKYDTMTFTPTTAGTYNVRINVKDKYGEGTVVSKDFKLTVTANSSALTNNSTVTATSVTAGTKITLNAKASGGTAPYKYAYYYKNSTDSAWSKLVMEDGSAYVESDSTKFTPKTAGTYYVRINVKDKDGAGTAVSKDFTITVK